MGVKSKWVGAVVFLAIYGVAVFLGTRAYYTAQPSTSAAPTPAAMPASALPPNHPSIGGGLRPLPLEPLGNDLPTVMDKANAAFDKKDYETAVLGYAHAVKLAPDNAALYNDLGLTLFYLGRTDEALEKLNKGVQLDPQLQRLWLTLGFVQSHAQHPQEARSALQKAIDLGADNEIGQEARKILDKMPN